MSLRNAGGLKLSGKKILNENELNTLKKYGEPWVGFVCDDCKGRIYRTASSLKKWEWLLPSTMERLVKCLCPTCFNKIKKQQEMNKKC